jgi:hypothetical protein
MSHAFSFTKWSRLAIRLRRAFAFELEHVRFGAASARLEHLDRVATFAVDLHDPLLRAVLSHLLDLANAVDRVAVARTGELIDCGTAVVDRDEDEAQSCALSYP